MELCSGKRKNKTETLTIKGTQIWNSFKTKTYPHKALWANIHTQASIPAQLCRFNYNNFLSCITWLFVYYCVIRQWMNLPLFDPSAVFIKYLIALVSSVSCVIPAGRSHGDTIPCKCYTDCFWCAINFLLKEVSGAFKTVYSAVLTFFTWKRSDFLLETLSLRWSQWYSAVSQCQAPAAPWQPRLLLLRPLAPCTAFFAITRPPPRRHCSGDAWAVTMRL